MYKSQTLDSIRQNIDNIDNTIHDLLMERAALASSIAAEKKKRGMPVVHPAREARMIRRLLGRHHGALPQQAVTRIWRELVSAVSMLQSGLSAVYSIEQDSVQNYKTITDYFGSLLNLEKGPDVLSSLRQLQNGDCDFAVFDSLCHKGDVAAWLPSLIAAIDADEAIDSKTQLSIVQVLPFVSDAETSKTRGFHVVMRAHFEPSDDDVSYVAYKSSGDGAAAVQNAMAALSVKDYRTLSLKVSDEYYYLCIINQYIDAESAAFVDMKHKHKDNGKWYHLGGHPKPIKV